jgi:hypothetical protein
MLAELCKVSTSIGKVFHQQGLGSKFTIEFAPRLCVIDLRLQKQSQGSLVRPTFSDKTV